MSASGWIRDIAPTLGTIIQVKRVDLDIMLVNNTSNHDYVESPDISGTKL